MLRKAALAVLGGLVIVALLSSAALATYWLHFRFPPQQAAEFDSAMREVLAPPSGWEVVTGFSGCHPLNATWLPLSGPTSCSPTGPFSAQHWITFSPTSQGPGPAEVFDEALASLPRPDLSIGRATSVPVLDGYGPTFDASITLADGTTRQFSCGHALAEKVAEHRLYFEEHPREATGITCEMVIAI